MTRSGVQRLGRWTLVVLAVVGLVVALLANLQLTAGDFLEPATVLVYGAVGVVVTRHRPENAVGWVFLLVAALLALVGAAGSLLELALAGDQPSDGWVVLSAWTYSWAWLPLLMLATTFTFLLFPSGIASHRWRWVLRTAVGATVGSTALIALYPALDIGDPAESPNARSVPNPLTPGWLGEFLMASESWLVPVFASLLLLCGFASVWCVVLRTWRSTGVERLQMRLFTFVILLVPVHILVGGIVDGWVDSVVGDFTFALIMLLIPVTCGVAILRYRLYDIDRIIGRTTAYVIVSGVLVATYAVVVTSLTSLVPESGSSATPASWTVAVATLAAAGFFRPVLGWARRLVARRFNRDQYDAELIIEGFALRLRDEVESDEVRKDLLQVLEYTVQPASAGLWLSAAQR